ncbi:hypothetical protein E2C01_048377 [Portunus trituberculatus]|uniref:Uncharacterized protein n=1 Tax=Portunus trituberculatus TaxID=210409 RepID=A0A5B7G2Z9_PORTR|nr:hypothetical protein [Portunus trituberculatus]
MMWPWPALAKSQSLRSADAVRLFAITVKHRVLVFMSKLSQPITDPQRINKGPSWHIKMGLAQLEP